MKNIFLIIVPFFISCISCESTDSKKHAESISSVQLCNTSTEKDREILTGLIFLDSKQNIIFDYDSPGWRQKIHLQPCGEAVRNYVNKSYDDFLNLRTKPECALKVSVSGWFSAKHSNGVPRDTFLFDTVSVLE